MLEAKMKFYKILLACGFIISTCQAYEDINVMLVSVYDGDTFKVNIKNYPAIVGEKVSIRVNGIDTPEIYGKCQKEKELAKSARDAAKELLACGNIILLNPKRDKYFRIVADVSACGINLSDALLKRSLAVPYDGGKKTKDWCK